MLKVLRTLFLSLLLLMAASLAHASAFQQGDQGDDVAVIQSRLNALGYDVSVDGDFGPATAYAVKAFQRDHGLYADGIVGAATYRALVGREIPVSRDSSGATARRVIATSMRYLGVPYVFGGTTPDGFDCSGFVRYVFAQSGIYLPRTADAQFNVGRYVSYSQLQPGDIVFFETYAPGPSHNGIYLGNGNFIAANSSTGVSVQRLDSRYWSARYIGARRVL